MDDVKTNIEKIFDEFDAFTQAKPKRLSFDYLNATLEALSPLPSNPKKRKLSLDPPAAPGSSNSSVREASGGASTLNASETSSLNASASTTAPPASPWEHRRLRADLLEAQTRIGNLKKEVEHQVRRVAETETTYRYKVEALEREIGTSAARGADLEKHLKQVRKRETEARKELTKLRGEWGKAKLELTDRVFELEQENGALKAEVSAMSNDFSNEVSELNQRVSELEEALETAGEELEEARRTAAGLQTRADAHDIMVAQLEQEVNRRETAEARVRQLESDLEAYGEWKQLERVTTGKFTHLADLERESERLRTANRDLHSTIGNKLLLEEQVLSLQAHLETVEREKRDAVGLQVRVDELEKEVAEWRRVAADHLPANTFASPQLLRVRIERILEKDVQLADERGAAVNERAAAEKQREECQAQMDVVSKQNEDLKRALKHHQTIVARLQRKLQLVAKERDCWKQLLDSYEKDLTISSSMQPSNVEASLRTRVEMLDSSVAGYKELVARMEDELRQLKATPDYTGVDAALTSDQHERYRAETESLRRENEMLRRRKDELELERETRLLRAEADPSSLLRGPKVLHLAANPAAEAAEAHRGELEKLQAELERLRKRNRKLEEGAEELTRRLDETAGLTASVKELNALRQKVDSLEAKNHHLKEVYRMSSQEFREVCYMLFGYRVDRVHGANYRISSMYAECEDEYLNFRLNDRGELDMLESPYSDSLVELVQTYLATHNSLPAFLSTLTLELFNKTTVMV